MSRNAFFGVISAIINTPFPSQMRSPSVKDDWVVEHRLSRLVSSLFSLRGLGRSIIICGSRRWTQIILLAGTL